MCLGEGGAVVLSDCVEARRRAPPGRRGKTVEAFRLDWTLGMLWSRRMRMRMRRGKGRRIRLGRENVRKKFVTFWLGGNADKMGL